MIKKVKEILGSKPDVEKSEEESDGGMGTPIAEYSEAGPFSCSMCWYLKSVEPRKDPLGLCNESHMLTDPETEKKTVDGETFAIVDKVHGCCRFIDPVRSAPPREEYVYAEDPEDEAKEHGSEGSTEEV